MLTVEQVRNIFTNFMNEKPEQWGAAVQTLIVELTSQVNVLMARQEQLVKGAFALSKEIKVLRGDKIPVSQATDSTTPDMANVDVSKPSTPEEVTAMEAKMDAAIAEAEAEKAGSTSSPQAPKPSAPKNGQQQKRRPTPAQAQYQGPPGTQAHIESQMDEAIAAMDTK